MISGSKKGVQSARLSADLLRPGTPLSSSMYPNHLRCGCLLLDINALEVKHCEPAESAQGRVSEDICCFHTSLKILTLHFAFVFLVVLSLPFDMAQFSNQQSEASTACFAKVLSFEKDREPLERAGEEHQEWSEAWKTWPPRKEGANSIVQLRENRDETDNS